MKFGGNKCELLWAGVQKALMEHMLGTVLWARSTRERDSGLNWLFLQNDGDARVPDVHLGSWEAVSTLRQVLLRESPALTENVELGFGGHQGWDSATLDWGEVNRILATKRWADSLGRFSQGRLRSRVGWGRRTVFLQIGSACWAQPRKDPSDDPSCLQTGLAALEGREPLIAGKDKHRLLKHLELRKA